MADASHSSSVNDRAPKLTRAELYRRHAAVYPVLFRSRLDYQLTEKPRQFEYGFLLVFALWAIGYYGQQFLGDSAAGNTRKTGVAIALCICTYCLLQTKDSLLVRPHPGFWRIVHGMGLLYTLLLAVLLVQDVDAGRQTLAHIFAGVHSVDDPFEGHIDLDCQFVPRTLWIQLTKAWAICHVIGSAAKMTIFRDWGFCLVNSILFEVCELSFQWLIPELKECWWDSLVLDVVCNVMGMIMGAALLRCLSSFRYDWSGGHPMGLKSILVRALPFYFSQNWDWGFFRTWNRLLWTAAMMVVSLALELNSFFLMYALGIPPPPDCYMTMMRLNLIVLLAVPATAEHCEYLTHLDAGKKGKKNRRIGPNAWLIVIVTTLESIVCLKYASSRFSQIVPDADVLIPVLTCLLCLSAWSFFRFSVVGTLRLQKLALRRHELEGALSSECDDEDAFLLSQLMIEVTTEERRFSDKKRVGQKKKNAVDPDSCDENLSGGNIPCGTIRHRTTAAARSSPKSTQSTPNGGSSSEVVGLLPADEDAACEDEKRRKAQWGKLYSVGLIVVKLPVCACFLPLVFLTKNYVFP